MANSSTSTQPDLEAQAQQQPGAGNVRKRRDKPLYQRLPGVLASLHLTIVLFALSIFLIFAGTLAQVDQGIWAVMDQYFRTTIAWINVGIFFPDSMGISGKFPYPGGWLLGGLILVNLISAHAVRFKVNRKRVGVLLIHAGLIVMVVSEFVTGLFATEGRMTIDEGQSASYTEDIRSVELAVIDRSPEDHNDVVVVPGKKLRQAGLIEHEYLPFDIEVRRFMKNSSIAQPSELERDYPNPATAGNGKSFVAIERPQVSGTNPNQQVDVASAYVTFKAEDSGESLGTYLVSQWFSFNDMAQSVTVGDKTYSLSLRFKRTYKDYTMHLIDFRHDKYLGTDKPKNFASHLRLIDRDENVDRKVKIYMNHPLRYEGQTFYQSSYKPDNSGTILQVVRNPGWMMPYISCAMVSGGLLFHFGSSLIKFLKRKKT